MLINFLKILAEGERLIFIILRDEFKVFYYEWINKGKSVCHIINATEDLWPSFVGP